MRDVGVVHPKAASEKRYHLLPFEPQGITTVNAVARCLIQSGHRSSSEPAAAFQCPSVPAKKLNRTSSEPQSSPLKSSSQGTKGRDGKCCDPVDMMPGRSLAKQGREGSLLEDPRGSFFLWGQRASPRAQARPAAAPCRLFTHSWAGIRLRTTGSCCRANFTFPRL